MSGNFSPLRPKNIHPELAAVARPSVPSTRVARSPGERAPRELPETKSWLQLRKRCGLTEHAERRTSAKRLRLTGPQKAAARRKRQQVAKRAVCRRVALWRSRIVDGERQVVYVTLGGDVLEKSGRAFRAATSDQKYLKACGISSGLADSSIQVPEEIEPYASGGWRENPLELAYWCIPKSVQASYRDVGIQRLHPWQAECLSSPEVLGGKSLVYVAPTSAGKSLVYEVLMLRQLLFRGRRALVILPYVSICEERVAQLRGSYGACGLRVEGLYSSSDGKWHTGADVAVCTIEKASTLLNHLLEDDSFGDVGVVVVDEIHLLGEEHRGYLLELILIKARLSAARASQGLQIIGLSATIPNVQLLADWLEAKLYVCHERPVPLTMSVAPKASAPRDPDGLVRLVQECVGARQSVLVFCPTKDWCEKAAELLADELKTLQEDQRFELLEELKLLPTGLCRVLAKTVPTGVAYHHAGLTVEERRLLEEAYRKGALCCLCATSTLAAGVNLPARRVIIRSLKVGSEVLDAVRLRQMAGRAGRVGLHSQGECIIMTRSAKDVDEANALLNAEMLPLVSSLTGQRLVRAVLEIIALGLIRTVEDLEGRFARSLLRFHQMPRAQAAQGAQAQEVPESLLSDIREALSYLEAQKLVRINENVKNVVGKFEDSMSCHSEGKSGRVLMATPLGDGVVHSALRPEEALSVFEALQKARQGLCLDSDLHLIFLVTPSNLEPDWSRYILYYEKLSQRDRAVANAVGISPDFLLKQSMGHRGPLSPGRDWRQDRERVVAVHRRFWTALALRELVSEAPASRVAAAFAASRGSLQSLQSLAATYCGMVRQLCERLRWQEMAAIFDCLMPRLSFGASTEVLPLCRIPAVYPVRARALLQAGLCSIEEVAKSSVMTVETVLRKLCEFESRRTDAELAQRQEAVIRQAAVKIVHGAQQCINEDLQALEDEAEDDRRRLRSR